MEETDRQLESMRMLDIELDRLIREETHTAGWLKAEEITAKAIARVDESPAVRDKLVARALTEKVRHRLRSMKNEDGKKTFGNVEMQGEHGSESVYRQVDLFDLTDYLKVDKYHKGVVYHHLGELVEYHGRAAAVGIHYQLYFEMPPGFNT